MNKVYMLSGVLLLFFLTLFWWKKDKNKGSSQKEIGEFHLPFEQKEDAANAMKNRYGNSVSVLSARDHKVREKLKEFEKKTSYITGEKIALEQARIGKKLKEVENQLVLEPEKEIIVDEQGEAWERLDYGQGIIRYNLVEENHGS